MHNTPNLTEKELMNDILTTEKQAISAYSTGITEASCPNFRNVLVNNLKSAEETQYKVFDAMRQKGWYQVKNAPTNDVQQAKNQANQMMTELR